MSTNTKLSDHTSEKVAFFDEMQNKLAELNRRVAEVDDSIVRKDYRDGGKIDDYQLSPVFIHNQIAL